MQWFQNAQNCDSTKENDAINSIHFQFEGRFWHFHCIDAHC